MGTPESSPASSSPPCLFLEIRWFQAFWEVARSAAPGLLMTSLLGVLNHPVASALTVSVVLLILGFLLLLARRFGGGQMEVGRL